MNNNEKYLKDKEKVLTTLMEAYKITQNMEGESVSGAAINVEIMRAIESIKKEKYRAW